MMSSLKEACSPTGFGLYAFFRRLSPVMTVAVPAAVEGGSPPGLDSPPECQQTQSKADIDHRGRPPELPGNPIADSGV